MANRGQRTKQIRLMLSLLAVAIVLVCAIGYIFPSLQPSLFLNEKAGERKALSAALEERCEGEG